MKKYNVLMVGVDKSSIGGMLTVTKYFLNSEKYMGATNVYYVGTATRKSPLIKILFFMVKIPWIIIILCTKKIDIVHVHMAEKTSVYRKGVVMRLARLFGCKIICQMHAGPFMEWYRELSYSKQEYVKKIINLPDRMLVLGNYWLKQMEEIVDSSKLGVLYNGVQIPENNNYNVSIAKDISFFGHLKATKGIYDFLEAISIIKNDLPIDAKVNLCGICDEIDIEKELSKRELEKIVLFHGWVDGEKKQDIFSRTAISVLPTYVEGLSMTVLEGMAMGIPVVTTNITTMPEIIDGIVEMIDPGNVDALAQAMLTLICDEQKRKEISDKEYKRVREVFSVERMIDTTLLEYSNIL